jgi:peroxiredoxin
MLKKAIISITICCAAIATAQQPSPLKVAEAIDKESRQLKDAPEVGRAPAIKKLALRIRQQPARFGVSLAMNLAIDNSDVSDNDAVQEIADTLVLVLKNARGQETDPHAYRILAELARYNHVRVAVDDLRYSAAMRELDSEEEERSHANFMLTDLDGKEWTLRGLRGKVVLLNFWATWCPPCRKEIPDLKVLYDRFKSQGLVILAISDEDLSELRRFVAEEKIGFPVLTDHGQKVKEAFHVDGIPVSFIYDRTGQLVVQAMSRPTTQGFLEILGQAGLH